MKHDHRSAGQLGIGSSKYDEIARVVAEGNQPAYRRSQVLHALFHEREACFADMSTLPRRLAGLLEERFGPSLLGLVPIAHSGDDQTDKLLFEMADGERTEAVHMRYRKGWHSYCISSQVGCRYACSFCASGAIGLKRDMTVDEITDQILYFHLAGSPIDSISFMGMGEALSNENVFVAMSVLTDPELFDLSPRRLTLSTIGLPDQMRRMTAEHPQVNLTLSLHSPFPEQRTDLMPINRRHPLDEVMAALDNHVYATRRKVYLAYVLLEGINDSIEHADAVAELVRTRPWRPDLYHVNLIRYNAASYVPESIHRSHETQVAIFLGRLRDRNVKATVRQSFGIDIDAACGQLYADYDQRTSRPSSVRISAINRPG